MEPKELLIRARKLIDDPKHWGQGHFAKNGRLCGSGALLGAGFEGSFLGNPAYEALRKAAGTKKQFCIWNDAHTHAEVLDVYDRAIASFN